MGTAVDVTAPDNRAGDRILATRERGDWFPAARDDPAEMACESYQMTGDGLESW